MNQTALAKQNIIVVGAGIAGLTAAIALAIRGFSVTVLEQSSELGDVGAGIQLQPNATRVLFALGLKKKLAAIAVEPSSGTLRLAQSGRIILRFNNTKHATGFPTYQVHRADFHSLLTEQATSLGVNILLNCGVKSYQQTNHSISVTTYSGKVYSGNAVIGADGVNSAMREAMFGPSQPVFSGNVAYRGLIEADKLNRDITPGGIIGPGRHFVLYYVRRGRSVNPGKGELINFVAQYETETCDHLSWQTRGDIEQLRQLYKNWDPQVTALLEQVEETFIWPLTTRSPMPRWSDGLLGLIGDACHPTLPNLASGAAMAIEDGYIIADLIEKLDGNAQRAFERFYQMRHPRCTKIQNQSEAMAKLFHISNPLTQFFKYTPVMLANKIVPSLAVSRLKWLHEYDATQAVNDWPN